MASTYMKDLTKEFQKKVRSVMQCQVTYPVKDGIETAGFRVDKETAIRLATQLLIAAETSESIFITGSRKDHTIRVARYNG